MAWPVACRLTALLAALVLVACSPVPTSTGLIALPDPARGIALRPDPRPPAPDQLALAKHILSDLQLRSFRQNREFCGYIATDDEGRLFPLPVNAGFEAACPLPRIPRGTSVVASFHTHGTYSPLYQSEFPTVQDMLIDAAAGTNGFISTPGGRLWYVDSRAMVVTQICGRACLPQDPFYDPDDDGDVRLSYTFDELVERERESQRRAISRASAASR
jgi:hypothetical protein